MNDELKAELLAALKEVLAEALGWYDECRGGDPSALEWAQRARSAIAKAEQNQQ